MRSIALCALLVCIASAFAHEPKTITFDDGTQYKLVPVTQPSTLPTPSELKLCANVESAQSFARDRMFIDAIKTSTRWGSATKPYDEQGPMGADGWPSGDAGTAIFKDAINVGGVYKFSCIGKCDLSAPSSPATITNLAYDTTTNRTTVDVTLKPSTQPTNYFLAFRNTSGGIKSIKLLRPGYATDAGLITDDFTRCAKPFSALRFMTWLDTNGFPISGSMSLSPNTIAKWQDRVQPGAPQYTIRGGCYEDAISIANKLEADPWLNIPAIADDDFITQFASLVRAKLNASRVCYVEYSNELWNGQFAQFAQTTALAKSAVAAGDKTLTLDGTDTNQWNWQARYCAQRAKRISELLGTDGRFRVVFCSHIVQPDLLKRQLDYIAKYYGAPSKFFYAVAGAGYFSMGSDEANPGHRYAERRGLTVDQVIARFATHNSTAYMQPFYAVVKAADPALKCFAYEGGLEIDNAPAYSLSVQIQAQYDPRMGAIISDFVKGFYANGGDALFYFTLTSKYGSAGAYGLTDDSADLSRAKYIAGAAAGR